ncbi:MAG: glyoxylate/hydroxypyruvate reductase A [Alphaproteobacteria bacterium]|nr:glyoxylate/hydroxypyruvate reductase A [Alphaproteobacteria bacterium]
MAHHPTLLLIAPGKWGTLWIDKLAKGPIRLVVHGRDAYATDAIDYALSFRPPAGLLKSLPNLKAAFSLGAGVDGFLENGDYPARVPLVRFVDPTLSVEMAQYVILQVLMHHRLQRKFDAAQRDRTWMQRVLPRRTEDTRVGFLGLGEIGMFTAERVADLGFPVSGWSRSGKAAPYLKSFAGEAQFTAFLGQADILVCLLSLTRQTKGILNARTFAALPKDAFVINAARGGHLIETDLIAALDCGHLSGAVLDVFETEPLPADSPLWAHPKVSITPHIAAISQPDVVVRYALDGIAAFERGERPANIVDVATTY